METLEFGKKNGNLNIISLSWIIFVLGSYGGFVYANVYHPLVLISFGVFAISGIILIFKKAYFDYFIIIFIGYHLISAVTYNDIYDSFSLVIYSVIFLFMYLVIKYLKYNSLNYVSYIIMGINLLNFLILNFSPVTKTRIKYIYNFTIDIRYVEFISFSVSALIALLSFIFAWHIKPKGIIAKLLKYLTLITSLYIIIFNGKLSILASFIIVFVLTFLIFKIIKNKLLRKIIIIGIIGISFSSSLFIEFIISQSIKYGINYELLLSGRQVLWVEYMKFFSDSSFIHQMFGMTYIRNINNIGGYLLIHPHNQYLSILITTGLVGMFLYAVLFYKAYKKSIELNDKRGFMLICTINLYGMTDDYIFLTVACINAFYLIYYLAIPGESKKNILKYHDK